VRLGDAVTLKLERACAAEDVPNRIASIATWVRRLFSALLSHAARLSIQVGSDIWDDTYAMAAICKSPLVSLIENLDTARQHHPSRVSQGGLTGCQL
jgi:hypothetical protein